MLNWYSRQVPLNYSEHAHMGWRVTSASSNEHAYNWFPISLSEMAQATAHLPVVIMRYQQCWLTVVLLGSSSLAGANIRKIDSFKHVFTPLCAQVYPFSLMPAGDGSGKFQLGIDQQCIVPLKDEGALPLFNCQRHFAAEVTECFHLLHRLKIDSEIVHSACELLAKKGLLALISESEEMLVEIKELSMPLYRVDIDAIGRLPREDFADLQMHHALELGIYQHSSLFQTAKLHHYAS